MLGLYFDTRKEIYGLHVGICCGLRKFTDTVMAKLGGGEFIDRRVGAKDV